MAASSKHCSESNREEVFHRRSGNKLVKLVSRHSKLVITNVFAGRSQDDEAPFPVTLRVSKDTLVCNLD